MDLTVTSGSPLRGGTTLAGDKSISHRAALLAAMARGESRIENFLDAGVTRTMLGCLEALEVPVSLEGTTLSVRSEGFRSWRPPGQPLDCGNSGTTMRLLLGALACAGIPAVLDGSAGLRRRPMARVVDPLRSMGVPVRALGEGGTAPIRIDAREPGAALLGSEHALPVASAQVKTAILLAGLAADAPTTVSEPGPSRDHTERMLPVMGVAVHRNVAERSVSVEPTSGDLAPIHATVPGDFSSAAFLLAAASITAGSEVRLRRVGLNRSRTGLLDALAGMGASIRVESEEELHGEPVGDLVVRGADLEGTTVEGDRVVRMIDEFPVLAVAAAFARGDTTVRDARELRFKESDRIAAVCSELRALGVLVDEHEDGMTVHGTGAVRGGTVDCHGDHRLAMALAVAGLASESPVRVRDAGILAESFPGFTDTLSGFGAALALR